MKINWVRKLSSRKFWALLVVLLSSNLVLFGLDVDTAAQVATIFAQFGSVVVYILVEGAIDKQDNSWSGGE